MKSTTRRSRLPNQKAAKNLNQVRIIGGLHKRRLISFVDADGLRPTPDRLRETLFNWLTGYLQDARVLDLCAGSGVLGFESISRGAAHATLLEFVKSQAQQLTLSAQTLGISTQVQIVHTDALDYLKNLNEGSFDIVFIDPPYAKDLWQPLLDLLLSKSILHRDSLIYLESDRVLDEILQPSTLATLNIQKQAKVGQAYAYLLKLSD